MNIAETDATTSADPSALLQMAAAYWTSQAIYVVAKLGIADILVEGPKSPDQIAQACQAHPDALHRVLRTLASRGIFAEKEDGQFVLTSLAEHLRSDTPSTLRDFILMLGADWHWRSWGELLHSVHTGEPAFDHVFGMNLFQYFGQDPEAGNVFNAAMTSRGRQEDAAVAPAYRWPTGSIVDVGGGRGSQLAQILRQNPRARGILFDLPHVIAAANLIEESGLSDRCELVEGDFFQSIPAGHDLYVLKKVIHDWDDERALAILSNCRSAIASNGRLLLVEHVLAPGNSPSLAKLIDLQMLALTPGGRERSEREYAELLGSAGFHLERVIPTESPISIIEAVPS